MRDLAMAKLFAFDLNTHGQFFWNFRTELEPRWDYMQSVSRGWLPSHWGGPDSPSALHLQDQLRQEMTRTCQLATASEQTSTATATVTSSLENPAPLSLSPSSLLQASSPAATGASDTFPSESAVLVAERQGASGGLLALVSCLAALGVVGLAVLIVVRRQSPRERGLFRNSSGNAYRVIADTAVPAVMTRKSTSIELRSMSDHLVCEI